MKAFKLAVITVFMLCTLQEINAQSINKEKDSAKKDQPKVDVKVNRKYDKDGNLIEFDSTYSAYYSTLGNDTLKFDSIMHSFRQYFDFNYPVVVKQHFDNIFDDSLWENDFFKHDFFSHQFMRNDEFLKKMFEDIDSIKNSYFWQWDK